MADQSDKGKATAVADKPDSPDMPASEDRTIIGPAEGEGEATPARPKYEPPYMVIVDGPRTGAHFPLSGEGPNIIGRASGNTIQLDDQSVSRQHAEITKGASGWTVKDLGSKNGTNVNGKPIVDVVVIGHKDVVKTGIYQLRLITQPTGLEEEMALPQDLMMSDRTVFVSAPPDSLTTEMDRKRAPPPEKVSEPVPKEASQGEGGEILPEVPQVEEAKPSKKRNVRQLAMLGVLAFVVIFAAVYFGKRMFFGEKEAPAKKPVAAKKLSKPAAEQPIAEGAKAPAEAAKPTAEGVPPEPGQPTAEKPVTATPAKQKPAVPAVKPAPVFLDFASSPMPVEVTFKGEKLGTTPLRVNVELEPDKTYTAEATFDMPEMRETFIQPVEFKVEKGSNVIPILFRGPIGMIKINDLPRDVAFYLEGKFSYDKFQERSAKLNEIILQKPIYIPYGEYFLELRRVKQLGQTAQTYVPDIIFRRDFNIASESPTFVLEVNEEDLATFPAKVRSEPPNANVYVDGKKVGVTPYEGSLPIGEHRLTLRKEGYFEHSEDLKVDINTPYKANVKLKTSLAGAHLNNAKLAMDREMWQDAINELAEALNSKPAPSEVAKANFMLGVCYLKLNDIQRAMGYFEQAREHEAQKYAAMLGLVEGYAMMQKGDKALPLLVEVMLKSEDESVKRHANDLFQKISPFRSVIYVYSEPSGADVVVNDKPVAQRTPVILHELPLGSYKIRVSKAGYQPTDMNLSLSVNEFNPVIMKLKPIPK